MSARVNLLPLLGLSLLLTRCAFTDNYELTSGKLASAGASGTHAAGSGSADTSGDSGAMNEVGGSSGSTSGGSSAAGASVGQAGSAGSSVCGSGCSELQTCCSTGCVDLTRDANNCGACGVACDAGRTCSASRCSAGWLAMAEPPADFAGRSRAATVAAGESLFIWGGLGVDGTALDTGALYSPVNDTWTPVAKGAGMPTARSFATALWTGTVVIVYGGIDAQDTLLKDASAYDPVTQTWSALPNAGTARSQALGFWDGTRAVFWGGTTTSGLAIAGLERFDLTTWTMGSKTSDPGALLGAATAFDGGVVYLLGGYQSNGTRTDKVYSYTTSTDNWSSLSKSLTVRGGAFSVWDGSHFIVWGGRDDNGLKNDGKYMSGADWVSMAAVGAPSARMQMARRSGWAFSGRQGTMSIVGGVISTAQTGAVGSDGSTYDSSTNTWKPIVSSGEPHDYGNGAWTGSEFVVWSGWNDDQLTTTGQRLAF